jgi:hypothetical protein
MKLDAIQVEQGPEEYESLVTALRAVAAGHNAVLDYDALCAGLGLSFTAVSTTAQSSPAWWLTYGRDVFVEETARFFGFRLRDLHPPDVGVDMLAADEFPQHFEISYKPLIRRALENGQPVLAWQGWEGDGAALWGVITAADGERFVGSVQGVGGEPVAHVAPAMQCYVVEAFEPAEAGRLNLLRMALRHADVYMNQAPFAVTASNPPAAAGLSPPSIVTGPAAFDAWEQWLSDGSFDDEAWNDHWYHAMAVVAGRRSASRFLREHGELAPQYDVVKGAMACCDDVAERLAPSCDEATVRERFATPAGRQALLQDLHAAEAADRRLAMRVQELVAVSGG